MEAEVHKETKMDEIEGVRWKARAAAQGYEKAVNNIRLYFGKSFEYSEQGEYEDLRMVINRGAKTKVDRALMALCYAYGYADVPVDHAMALAIIEDVSKKRIFTSSDTKRVVKCISAIVLGRIYEEGICVSRDYEKAKEYYIVGTDLNYVRSLGNYYSLKDTLLGVMELPAFYLWRLYVDGKVKKDEDFEDLYEWDNLDNVLPEGGPHFAMTVAQMYATGSLVEKDLVAAITLYLYATEVGSVRKEAEQKLAELEGK